MTLPGLIILAAGNSSRLGSPKQLLPVQHGNLLQHAVQVALNVIKEHVIVVLGAHVSLLEPVLKNQPVHIVHNEQWQEGIAASITSGLHALLSLQPHVQAALFMVCDQPYVTPSLLQQIIETHHQTGKAIIASAYKDITGTPALFDKTIFPQLLALKGDTGAKKIIAANRHLVETVPFPKGAIDIDTMEDYNSYKSFE